MAKARNEFTEILVRRQVLSPDQLEEARGLERQAGMKLPDAIVKLGYATNDQVMSAIAERPKLRPTTTTVRNRTSARIYLVALLVHQDERATNDQRPIAIRVMLRDHP